jgi:hypothetical protein
VRVVTFQTATRLQFPTVDVETFEEVPYRGDPGVERGAFDDALELRNGVVADVGLLRRSMTRRAEALRPQPAVPKVTRPAGR